MLMDVAFNWFFDHWILLSFYKPVRITQSGKNCSQKAGKHGHKVLCFIRNSAKPDRLILRFIQYCGGVEPGDVVKLVIQKKKSLLRGQIWKNPFHQRIKGFNSDKKLPLEFGQTEYRHIPFDDAEQDGA